MNNYEIAKILHEIAFFEEMKGEKFKPRVYEKAALYIGSLSDDLATIYKKGGNSSLMELPGIGKSIAEKLSELIRTGKLQYYADLKREIPVDVAAFTSGLISGLVNPVNPSLDGFTFPNSLILGLPSGPTVIEYPQTIGPTSLTLPPSVVVSNTIRW